MRRDEIGAAAVPFPEHEVVMRALDKLELQRAADEVGMASPPTRELGEGERFSRGPRSERPVLVKARLHSPAHGGPGPSMHAVQEARGSDELREKVEEMRARGAAPLVQKPVDGDLMAISLVADRESRPGVGGPAAGLEDL